MKTTIRHLLNATVALTAALHTPAFAQTGLPQNLPAGLPADLLLSPWDADRIWIEQWGSNDDWESDMWRTGQQIGSFYLVDYDNTVLINDRSIYRSHLQNITPVQDPPNQAGQTVWVGTARPDDPSVSGNDNINVGAGNTFTIGELTVQNVSPSVGRSFRNSGTVVFNSGNPSRNARIVHLGGEASEGDDMNIRGGTGFRLDSDTDMYLLNTTSRFRIRDNSQISGTGKLILNPGNALNYTGESTGQGPIIQRELRIEDAGRIATTGEIHIHSARIRIGNYPEAITPDIINTSGIFIHREGQLRLDRPGTVTYDLNHGGGAVITLDSAGHRMDDGSNGAIRQQADTAADIATVANAIVLAGNSRIHARGEGTLILSGPISGTGRLRKTGEGILRIRNTMSQDGGLEVDDGTVFVEQANALPFAPLTFISPEDDRALYLTGNQTVSLLDGDSTDPDEPDAVNTLLLHLGDAGDTLTVNQSIFYDSEDEEESTRFQGEIAGDGNFVKDGDGMLRFTRWAKSYTGSTTIQQGVLAVSESAALANTSGITVQDGGQLRLTTSGSSVLYNFGGTTVLSGAGRGGNVSEGAGLGILGALRYDPGGGEQTATVASPVHLATDAGIHVDGGAKTLILAQLSGSGDLTKSGGGTLVLNDVDDFDGDVLIDNGELSLLGAFLPEATSVRLSDSATIRLDYAGTNTIASLWFDGIEQAAGIWGRPGSGADHEAEWISGPGLLEIQSDIIEPEPFSIAGMAVETSGDDFVVSVGIDSTGHHYSLEFRTNLVEGIDWTVVAEGADESALVHTNAAPSGFYRVRAVPAP